MGRVVSENSLRARRRVQTRSEIHNAAVELVLERGFNEVTVDEIAEAAGVSPRTFFNYFSTKQEAIFPGPPQLDSETIELFITGTGSLLEDLRNLISNYAELALKVRPQLVELRPICAAQPEIWIHLHKRFGDLEQQLAQAIAQRRHRADPTSDDYVIAAVSTSVMRSALRCWARLEQSDSATALTALIDRNFAAIKIGRAS